MLPSQVGVRGTEVVQTVQTLANDVRLIAGKATVVRVYLDADAFSMRATVSGELAWRRNSGGVSLVASIKPIDVGPAQQFTLQQQRFDIARSLNFVLPPAACGPGNLTVRLNGITTTGGAAPSVAAHPEVTVEFVEAPTLHIRAVGLRYISARTGATVTPSAVHFDYLRSYLQRAYPTAVVNWSQTIIDGDGLNPSPQFPDGQSNRVNAQLSALREREVSAGVDPRTHYYGLVDDDQGVSFMRGSASASQVTGIFLQVASGPCGVGNGFAGDDDASYADWYGAHELGHTFQRRHPGFPTGRTGQPRDPLETGFPYPDGFISTADQSSVGFDFGDVTLGLPMQALPGNVYHDVMTYANDQWLSAYTHHGIHDRLIEEDQILGPPVL